MLSTVDILGRLNYIDTAYQAETDTVKALLWAKLAVLEVGGWTEECIDKIVTDYLDSKNPPSKQKILEKLKNIYGFQYAKDFQGIWIEILGRIILDKIEARISLECQQLQTALNALKKSRDISAHTYIKPGMPIDAPSKTKALLSKIDRGLSAFKTEVDAIVI